MKQFLLYLDEVSESFLNRTKKNYKVSKASVIRKICNFLDNNEDKLTEIMRTTIIVKTPEIPILKHLHELLKKRELSTAKFKKREVYVFAQAEIELFNKGLPKQFDLKTLSNKLNAITRNIFYAKVYVESKQQRVMAINKKWLDKNM